MFVLRSTTTKIDPLVPFFEVVRFRWVRGLAFWSMEPVSCLLDAKSLAARYLFASTTSLPTRRRVNGATTRTVGNATIQLLNQAVIHMVENTLTSIFVNLAKLFSKKHRIFLQTRSCNVKLSRLNGEMVCPVF